MISYSFNLIVFFMYPHITNKLPKTIIGEQLFNPNLASENLLAVEFQSVASVISTMLLCNQVNQQSIISLQIYKHGLKLFSNLQSSLT